MKCFLKAIIFLPLFFVVLVGAEAREKDSIMVDGKAIAADFKELKELVFCIHKCLDEDSVGKAPFVNARFEHDMELSDYLKKKQKYPIDAKTKGVQGCVLISFVVHSDGSLTDLSLVRKVYPSLDDEAMRLVYTMMGKWRPAIFEDGSKACSKVMIPIKFKL